MQTKPLHFDVHDRGRYSVKRENGIHDVLLGEFLGQV